ncbi:lipase 3-like [Diorhabda carinulata]|uniref:lipase 3-like n=1 Tax=Diorhabda carinulata TaxID=1163345 RepID=UPI0025A0733B|nr:lipase 3-like [Diorhabda carinulata]
MKRAFVIFYFTQIFCAKCEATNFYSEDSADVADNANLNINQLAGKYGYQCESHWVTTEDGYVLVMHRIRNASSINPYFDTEPKPAVLIMHGVTGSSMEWVNLGPGRGLGFDLVKAGYDVWLGNNRGNMFSRYHVRLNPDEDDDYWDFSFEDCGYYDLPAKIDYILNITGQQKLFYVGLSQGTTQFFAMASLRPEYNDKIALMSALGPVAFMNHTSSPLIRLAVKILEPLEKLMKRLDWHEVLGYNSLVSKISQLVCSNNSALIELCVLPRFILFGFDSQQLDRSTLAVETSHSPAGTSVKSLIHYGQQVSSGYFRRYDYGTELNRKHYNTDTPPDYNLSVISAPIVLYYGQNDLIASVQDVERLSDELPNAVKSPINYKRWNHIDFYSAKDVYKLLNVNIIKSQQEFIDNGTLITTTTTTSKPSNNGAYSVNKEIFLTLITLLMWLINF